MNELVDFDRPPSAKDLSGWHGPAKVIENMPEKGQVAVQWNNRIVLVRYPDIRRFMAMYVDMFAVCRTSQSPVNNALRVIDQLLDNTSSRSLITLGTAWFENKWLSTKATNEYAQILVALQFIARHAFRLEQVVTIRLGRDITNINVPEKYDSSYLIVWTDKISETVHVDATTGATKISSIIGQSENTKLIQFLCTSGAYYITALLAPGGQLTDHISFHDEQPAEPLTTMKNQILHHNQRMRVKVYHT